MVHVDSDDKDTASVFAISIDPESGNVETLGPESNFVPVDDAFKQAIAELLGYDRYE